MSMADSNKVAPKDHVLGFDLIKHHFRNRFKNGEYEMTPEENQFWKSFYRSKSAVRLGIAFGTVGVVVASTRGANSKHFFNRAMAGSTFGYFINNVFQTYLETAGLTKFVSSKEYPLAFEGRTVLRRAIPSHPIITRFEDKNPGWDSDNRDNYANSIDIDAIPSQEELLTIIKRIQNPAASAMQSGQQQPQQPTNRPILDLQKNAGTKSPSENVRNEDRGLSSSREKEIDQELARKHPDASYHDPKFRYSDNGLYEKNETANNSNQSTGSAGRDTGHPFDNFDHSDHSDNSDAFGNFGNFGNFDNYSPPEQTGYDGKDRSAYEDRMNREERRRTRSSSFGRGSRSNVGDRSSTVSEFDYVYADNSGSDFR